MNIKAKICNQFTGKEKNKQYLVHEQKHSPSLKQVLIKKQKIKNIQASQYDINEMLTLLRSIISMGVNKFGQIFQAVQKYQQNSKNQIESIIDFSRKYKDEVEYQIMRNALLIQGLVSLGVIKLEKDKSFTRKQINQAMELLIGFNLERLLNGEIDEIEYFRPLINQNYFVDTSYSIINKMCKQPQIELIIQRYQYLMAKRPNKIGAKLYCLTHIQQLQRANKKYLSWVSSQWLENQQKDIRSKKPQFNRKKYKLFYLYKAKIKYQLQMNPLECLKDLSNFDLLQKQVSSEQWKMYEHLKAKLFSSLKRQQENKEELINIYQRYGLFDNCKQLLLKNWKQFQLNEMDLQQIEQFINFSQEKSKHIKNPNQEQSNNRIPIQRRQQNRQQGNDLNRREQDNREERNRQEIIQENRDNQINLLVNNNLTKKKILSIEGGGIKGLFALMVLAQMQYRTGKKVYQMFNFFTGTSIGGIFALCFASKRYGAQQLLQKMLGQAKNQIFHNIFLKNYTIGLAIKIILRGYVYKKEPIEQLCKQMIGELPDIFDQERSWCDFLITSVIRQNDVYVPCFFYKVTQEFQIRKGLKKISVSQDQLIIFNNAPNFERTKIWQVMRATSAASPLLPSIIINNFTFFDGGFIFNNPLLIAIKFLQSMNVKRETISCLSMELNPLNQNLEAGFNFFDTVSQLKQMIRLFESRKILYSHQQVKLLLRYSTNISLYTNKKARQILGPRLIFVKPILGRQRGLLDQVALDSVDFNSIKNLQKAAELTINRLDRQNILNRICLYFSEYNQVYRPDLPMRRVLPRYSIFKNCYRQLDQLFQKGNITNQKLTESLKSFSFPNNVSERQQRIQLSRRVKNYPIIGWFFNESALPYALAIGHYKSIRHFLPQDNVNNIRFHNNWNVYHSCIANDEFISLHVVLTSFILGQFFEGGNVGRLINLSFMNVRERAHISQCIGNINNIMQNEQGDTALLLSSYKNSQQFITYFNSGNIKKYLTQLNRYFLTQAGQNPNRDEWQIRFN